MKVLRRKLQGCPRSIQQWCYIKSRIRVGPLEEVAFDLKLVRGSHEFIVSAPVTKPEFRESKCNEPREGRNVGPGDGRAGNHFLIPVEPMPSSRTFFSNGNVQFSELSNMAATGHM